MAWRKRSLRDEMAAREDKSLFNAEVGLYATKDLAAQGAFWAAAKASIKTVIEGINSLVVKATPEMFRLAGSTINQITGIGMDENALEAVAERNPDRDQTVAIGAAFLPVVTRMFPIDKAAAGTANRLDRDFARDNLNAYFGTNLLFQLRSLTISTVASFVPYFQLRHLEGLHQSINWAFGFGWLSWSVLSAIMDVTTTKPLKEYYNRQIKPNDYTHAQTVDAFTRGLITEEIMHQVMDNDGIRDDIRANLVEMHLQGLTVSQAHQAYIEGRINESKWDDALDNHSVRVTDRQLMADMAEKELSKATLQELWDWGAIDEANLKQHLRWSGYREARATIEADLIELDRLRGLRKEKLSQSRKLFRDCLLQEWELRQILADLNYSLAEQNAVVEVELLARKQRTFISVADMARSIKLGLMDASEAIPELLCRGYTPGDALRELVLRVMDELPECKEARPGAATLIQDFQLVAATYAIAPGILSPALLRFLQCLGTGVTLIPPTATLSVKPDIIYGNDEVELTWETTGATEVHISHGIGRVPLSGQTFFALKNAASFELTATNAIGVTKVYALVRLELPPPGPPAPVVSAVSPATGPATGGTPVTITGAGFTGATMVSFGFGSGIGTSVVSDTQITTTTPPGTGLVDVKVLGAGGLSETGTAAVFTYV